MSFVGKFIDKEQSVLNHINPDKFYVENIRRFYNLPLGITKYFCEMAVKQGYFNKKYAVQCPSCDRLIDAFSDISEIPSQVKCDICELNQSENFIFSKSRVKIVEYYQLNRDK
ncbi:MAG: hypothetical protein JNM41_04590 [Flavipsychrobacter sp.]|nr:hypothetical protein [Flavipsychrobacter sp.]